ncbi:MAG: hypothetical protein F6K17_08155 [Okeania sp. SIO3C4]|nr:hypothetical protein [Okeania sp. SIO3C4]
MAAIEKNEYTEQEYSLEQHKTDFPLSNQEQQLFNFHKGLPCRLTNPKDAVSVLPVWFVERMMTDNWNFALLLTTGQLMLITNITSVSIDWNKELWIDVILETEKDARGNYDELQKLWGQVVFSIDIERTKASIKVSNIVAAFDYHSS